MWRMMQLESPDDFVIATGETHSVREFLEVAFDCAGLDWKKYVEIDPRYFRPREVDHLQGDASKAARILDWHPKVKFHALAELMVEADIKVLEDQLNGHVLRQAAAQD
jgi:GDPmannose 4,6-dehydratase